jgi:secretion/DNA translocation related TadE-like protein
VSTVIDAAATHARAAPDRGLATIWAAAAVAALVAIAVLGINLGAAIVGRHRAEAAADLAALAAASHAADGALAACAQGARVTDAMAVALVSCHLSGWDAYVETEVHPPVPALPGAVAHGRARAGLIPE